MGNYSKHVIEVETKFVTVNGKSMVDSKKTVEGLGRGVTQTTTSMRDWDSEGKKMISTGRTLTKGFQKFQMENLGVMFAGMALNRSMANLNATSREWLGIGELTSSMMGITMLDANMDLLQFGILPLFDALINLPPAAQRAIGLTAIALEGLSGVMMVGGQLMLGLDSTATLLAKIAGVRPEIIFSSKGLSALKTNLAPVMKNLGTAAKYAAAGILIGIAIKDFNEGQFVAALGDTLAAVGIVVGGPGGIALMSVGVVLKLVGDEDFLVSVLKTLYKIGRTLNSIIKEAIVSGFTMRNFNVDNIEGFANISRAFGRAIEEIQQEEAGKGIFDVIAFPENMLNKVEEDLEKLYELNDNDLIEKEDYLAELDRLVKKKEDIMKRWIVAYDKNKVGNAEKKAEEMTDLTSSSGALPTVGPMGFNPISFIANLFKDKKSVATGGNIGSSGSYYLHEGETVLRKDQAGNQSGNITVTYNVNVSDKREFEQMLRANNDKLTADVRRMSKV